MSKKTSAPKLTQEKLKELLDYDPETGVFTWAVARQRITKGAVAGSKASKGYRQIRINNKPFKEHRLAWLYVYGYFPENDIDHVDRNRSNNMISNLREVSRSCNLRNTGNSVSNTSGVKGVGYHRQSGKWRSSIGLRGKTITLGRFDSFHDAVISRWNAEKKYKYFKCNSTSPAYNFLLREGYLID